MCMEYRNTLLILIVLTAGCATGSPGSPVNSSPASGGAEDCITDADARLLDQYPSSLPEQIAVVVPEMNDTAITRSIKVLTNHHVAQNRESPSVIESTQLSLQDNRSLVVLAPRGTTPQTFDQSRSSHSGATGNVTRASVSVFEHPRNASNNVIMISGGAWGIRAAVDILTERSEEHFGPCGEVSAEISVYSGKVEWTSSSPMSLIFNPHGNDTNLFVAASPARFNSKAANQSFNTTVRGYRTTVRVTEFVGGEKKIREFPAIEIATVESGEMYTLSFREQILEPA